MIVITTKYNNLPTRIQVVCVDGAASVLVALRAAGMPHTWVQVDTIIERTQEEKDRAADLMDHLNERGLLA